MYVPEGLFGYSYADTPLPILLWVHCILTSFLEKSGLCRCTKYIIGGL